MNRMTDEEIDAYNKLNRRTNSAGMYPCWDVPISNENMTALKKRLEDEHVALPPVIFGVPIVEKTFMKVDKDKGETPIILVADNGRWDVPVYKVIVNEDDNPTDNA